MNPENFCYWLNGWFELNQTIDHREGATKETLEMIKNHLDLVFEKITPVIAKPSTPTLEETFSKAAIFDYSPKKEDTRYC